MNRYSERLEQPVENSLRGTALGDSLGLIFEGMPATRVAKWRPLPLRQRILPGVGLLSDDTLLSVCTLMSASRHPNDPALAQKAFARLLRTWFWALPPGIGLSTAKACLKLSIGVSPERSGVPSGGNGVAMRSVMLGALIPDDHDLRDAHIESMGRVTHTHPLALTGAKVVAMAASMNGSASSASNAVERFSHEARARYPDWDFEAGFRETGPSGFVVETVQAALRVWAQHPRDLPRALEDSIVLGGDTDSVAAIVGGIVGAGLTDIGVPNEWERWLGWPQPDQLCRVDRFPYLPVLATNLVGIPVVVAHGLRRLLPPYG